MAIDKKTLQRFLDNPANVSAEDMELEDSEQTEESPEGELQPEEMIEEEPYIEPEIVAEDTESLESQEPMMVSEDIDSDLLAKLKKLKAGESIDEEEMGDEEAKEVANDSGASVEMRKKALQLIKEKYLGKQ